MKTPEQALQRLRERLPKLQREYGRMRLWLVNPEALTTKRQRPVFLVELAQPLTLIEFVGLEQAIGRAVGKKVLLVSREQYQSQHGADAVLKATSIAP